MVGKRRVAVKGRRRSCRLRKTKHLKYEEDGLFDEADTGIVRGLRVFVAI